MNVEHQSNSRLLQHAHTEMVPAYQTAVAINTDTLDSAQVASLRGVMH